MSCNISLVLTLLIFSGVLVSASSDTDLYFSKELDYKTEETYRTAFRTYDLDDDNQLDAYEIHQLFVDLFPISLFNTTSARNRVPKRTLDKLSVMLDINGDGRITIDEFRKIWLFWLKPLLQPKSVLILLNIQNNYVLPEGNKYVPGAKHVIPKINTLLARNHFDKVVIVKDYQRDNCYVDLNALPANLNLNHTYLDHKVLQEIFKHNTSESAIYDSNEKLPLYHVLSGLKPKSDYIIYIGGFHHDTDVMRTALDCYHLGFPVVLVREITPMSNALLASAEDQLTKALDVERILAAENIVTVSDVDVESLSRGQLRKVETGLMLANKFYQKYMSAKKFDTSAKALLFDEDFVDEEY